jgi:hypothetical protein
MRGEGLRARFVGQRAEHRDPRGLRVQMGEIEEVGVEPSLTLGAVREVGALLAEASAELALFGVDGVGHRLTLRTRREARK